MVDSEKQENLANARRKLKKFRDQHQTNGDEIHSSNGTSVEFPVNYNMMPQIVNENGIHPNSSKSPIDELEEQNRQYALLVENQKLQRSRLEHQRQSSGGSNVSGRSSQASIDIEQKLRRDIEHLQDQLEVHVQTIGVLVAEKTDVSAKLTQSFKQLERKQSEMDELHGRLKASRERVQELEKQMQNSTSNVQKREMAAKESDKENDRLKIENIRQSQMIEDLKQEINGLNEKLLNRQNLIDQLNTQLQSQTTHDTSTTEQQMNELQQKNNQIEELVSTINRIRSDNDQYQQYNTSMQNHIQELNNQINQLTHANNILQSEHDTIKTAYETKFSQSSSIPEQSNLQQENDLFRNAIDQWSNRYEGLRIKLEQTTKLLNEKDEFIAELQTNGKKTEIEEEYNKISNENTNLKNQIQILQQNPSSKSNHEQETQTEGQQTDSSFSSDSNNDHEKLVERFNRAMHENADLKDRIQELDHVVLQLQSETETIGDYIYLYQQQREQLQRRYQEKDDYIKQLTQDRLTLQRKISEFEILFIRSLQNQSINEINSSLNDPSNTIDNSSETKARMLELIKELGNNHISSPQNDSNSSSIKLAFVDKNLYICSTCSGPVQWV